MAGSAPITQAAYTGAVASSFQQRIYNNASTFVRAGGSNPQLNPDADDLRSLAQQSADFYQSYIQSYSSNPIGGPSDSGH
jgi:hypothetical protein